MNQRWVALIEYADGRRENVNACCHVCLAWPDWPAGTARPPDIRGHSACYPYEIPAGAREIGRGLVDFDDPRQVEALDRDLDPAQDLAGQYGQERD